MMNSYLLTVTDGPRGCHGRSQRQYQNRSALEEALRQEGVPHRAFQFLDKGAYQREQRRWEWNPLAPQPLIPVPCLEGLPHVTHQWRGLSTRRLYACPGVSAQQGRTSTTEKSVPMSVRPSRRPSGSVELTPPQERALRDAINGLLIDNDPRVDRALAAKGLAEKIAEGLYRLTIGGLARVEELQQADQVGPPESDGFQPGDSVLVGKGHSLWIVQEVTASGYIVESVPTTALGRRSRREVSRDRVIPVPR